MKRPGWKVLLLGAAFLWIIPLGSLLGGAFFYPAPEWDHVATTLLSEYVTNTLLLTLGTLLFSGALGLSLAWVTVRYQFPGKNLFVALQLLPLAIPAFLGAATWKYLLEYTGPLGTLARSLGFSWFLSPPSGLPFAIFLLSLALYPYVFLTLRPVLLNLNSHLLDTARLSGWSPGKAFRRVVIPLVRPALVGGLSLVAMEALNEYGLPVLMGFPTFTTGIFQTWFGLGDVGSALRLALVLAGVWAIFFALERWGRGQKQYTTQGAAPLGQSPRKTSGLLVWSLGGLPLFLGFAAPLGQMFHWLFYLRDASFSQLGSHVLTTLVLLVLTVLPALSLGILASYGRILVSKGWSGPLRYLIPLGYALPGAVLALAVMALGGSLVTASLLGLVAALTLRFTGVALPTLDSVARQGGKSLLEASLTLGFSPGKTLGKVHLPLWAPSLLAGACLVAVDLLKELPLTTVLRPFNVHTLATRTFEMVQNEIPMDAAPSGLLLVALAWLAAWGGQTLLSRRKHRG